MNDKKSATPDVEIGHGTVILRCGGSETVVTKDEIRIINTNFSNHGTVLECRFQPEKGCRQKSEEAGCRLAAFLKRLRGRGQRKERYSENRG